MNPRLNIQALESAALRALSCANNKSRYKLGRGGFSPGVARPEDFDTRLNVWECDCSGFAAWCLGISRKPKPSRRWWVETTNIFNSAQKRDGDFVELRLPVRGALLVYPDKNGRQGHVAVITGILDDGDIVGVDCSSGSSRRLGRAIVERDLGFMLRSGAKVVTLRQNLAGATL